MVGQGRRSKVKVTRSERNSHVKSLWPMMWLHVTPQYDVMTSHIYNGFVCVSQSIANKGLWGKRTVQFGKHGRYVNAQAFSFRIEQEDQHKWLWGETFTCHSILIPYSGFMTMLLWNNPRTVNQDCTLFYLYQSSCFVPLYAKITGFRG